jgi:hypothetical protein
MRRPALTAATLCGQVSATMAHTPGADEGWMMAGNGDLKAHESTYSSVTKMLFWGAIACAVIVALVIWLIA